jgi:hypothetical protein
MPSDVPSSLPSDVPSSLPSDVPSSMPSDVPSMMPSDVPSSMPSDVPSLAPSSMPSDVPSMMPSDVPSQPPSDGPSAVIPHIESDYPSLTPSDQPSLTPSDVPSLVPSDVPSLIPSDVPSLLPSDLPSSIPSDLPSTMPASSFSPSGDRDVIIPNSILPDGFESCPAIDSQSIQDAPQLTIIYRYRLAVLPGYDISSITSQIEALFHTVLLNGVCTDDASTGALAVSPGPPDVAGSACEQREERREAIADSMTILQDKVSADATEIETSCYSVAGRATLLISVNGILDTANLYCTALESIRSSIAGGSVLDAVEGIDAIESPLLGSIIPALCSLLPDTP